LKKVKNKRAIIKYNKEMKKKQGFSKQKRVQGWFSKQNRVHEFKKYETQ
jgi:hypothetical protein